MDETTATAPVAANADAGQAGQSQAVAPEAGTSSPAPKAETEGQATSAQTSQPSFDVQRSYEELRKQFTKVTQDYSKDRRTWNQTLSELQHLKQLQGQLAEQLSKATEVPIDPAQFLTDLQTHGPKAMDGYVNKRIESATAHIQSAYVEQANRALDLELRLERMARRMDTENYPDFKKLEPIMEELSDPASNISIDWNQPVGVIYDTLYKLARSKSSDNAVKAAEEFGRKSAEEQLGKEARTAVPTSGGAGAPVDPTKVKDISKLREYFVSQLGEAE